MIHFPAEKISFSSLNHLTSSGADPVKAAFITTLVPGGTSCDSGFTVKAGGSVKQHSCFKPINNLCSVVSVVKFLVDLRH